MTPPTRPIMQRFWEKVDIGHPDDCWEWQATRRRGGYGGFAVTSNEIEQAHRVAYSMSKGPIPDGLLVCHSCDNPPCCNPDHLWLGTNQDNTRDAIEKGRMMYVGRGQTGEQNCNSRLREQDVFEIRASRRSSRYLANRYGVGIKMIQSIIRGDRWKHLL